MQIILGFARFKCLELDETFWMVSEYIFAKDPSIPTIVALGGEAIRPNEDTWSWNDIERINRAFCGKPW
jgi:hypothetical protein